MSLHNLAVSNQFEINAKSPKIVAVVDETVMNMAIGKEFNHELQEYHYGFSAGMGRVSENAEVVLGEVLDYFQVQGEGDQVHIGFAAGAQLAGVTSIQVTVGELDIALTWNAGNTNYESAEIPGIGDLARRMVGGRYPMTLTDTT